MTLPDLEDLNLFWINLMCIFVIIKGIIHVFYFYLVRLVNVSINDFGAGDDVAVVLGLGALEVPPGTAVAVGAVPGGLAPLPVDVTGIVGWVVSVAGASGPTPPSGTSSSASSATSPASSVVPAGWLGGGCCYFCCGVSFGEGGHDGGVGGVGGPDIVSFVEDVLPGGGVESHVSDGGSDD